MSSIVRVRDERHEGTAVAVLEGELDTASVAPVAEYERRLETQIRMGLAQQLDQGLDDIGLARAKQLDRAAENTEIVVIVSQRIEHGADHLGRAPAAQRSDGCTANAPILVADCAEQGIWPDERLVRERLRGTQPHAGIGAGQLRR